MAACTDADSTFVTSPVDVMRMIWVSLTNTVMVSKFLEARMDVLSAIYSESASSLPILNVSKPLS